MDFRNIVGHEDIIRHFKSSIEMHKISHAYIINGEAGSGKRLLSDVFAKALQCDKMGIEPCNDCQSCLQVQTGNHPDIITVTHEKPNIISVDEVREQILDTIAVKPYKSRYKVYIVPDAHLMNPQAQNAILKTIEEPPEYAILILLTTNINRMLSTVMSRCMVLNTKPIRERDMLEYLMKEMGLSEDKAYFCLDFAQGNLGKAIKLASNDEYVQVIESVVKVLKSIPDMDVEDLTWAVSQIDKFKLSIDDYMDLMMMWYRDVLLFKVTGNVNKLLFKNEYSSMKNHAKLLSYESIENKIDAIAKAKKRIDVNANFDMTMELLLLTLKEK